MPSAPLRKIAPPETPLEYQLLDIWARVLGRRDIGTRCRFAEVGGDAAHGREIARAVRDLDPRGAVAGPEPGTRIRDMARAIVRHHGPQLRPVTRLRAGTGANFFYCHGDWTTKGLYASQVARALGDYSVFALHPGEGITEASRLEGLAGTYLAEIARIQPTGPLLIGGFSAGGLLAHEIARQLTARGREVACVVMIDAASPNARPALRLVWSLSRIAARYAPEATRQALVTDLLPAIWWGLWRFQRLGGFSLRGTRKIAARMASQMKLQSLARSQAATRRAPESKQSVRWFKIMCNHRPTGYLEGKLICIVSEGSRGNWMYSPKPWTPFAVDVLHLVAPGDHLGCITTHASELGRLIHGALSSGPTPALR